MTTAELKQLVWIFTGLGNSAMARIDAREWAEYFQRKLKTKTAKQNRK